MNTKTKEGCPLEFDIVDKKIRDRRSGEALSQDKAKEIERDLCATKGATIAIEVNQAREAAGKAVIEFMNRKLKS